MLLWRGVPGYPGCGNVPGPFSLGLFALILLDFANTWDPVYCIGRRSTPATAVFAFSIFLDTAGSMALFLFVLFS